MDWTFRFADFFVTFFDAPFGFAAFALGLAVAFVFATGNPLS